jgi:hypothetical protein
MTFRRSITPAYPLPSNTNPADFSEMVRHNAAQFYGTAGQAFVERLIKEMPNLDLHAELSEIVKTLNAKA